MITINYSCDRCGTYFDADDLIQIDISSIEYEKYNRAYDLCPGCATKLINQFIKEGTDVDTNNMLNS